MKEILMRACVILCCMTLLLPSLIFAQPKPLRELTTSYPLGGSSSYFWTAYRAGSVGKHGLKINPVFIPGGVTALQSLMAKELLIQLTAGPAAVRAWARGGKEITFIGAVGNRLDYVLVTVPSVRNAEELKGKRIGVSQLGASPDFIARLGLRQMGLNPERDVTIVPIGSPGERWAALNAGHVHASLFQPPFTLRARKSGFLTLLDFSTLDFPYILSGVLTTRSFIRSDRDTVKNFMRGLSDGMDFYRDEKNKDRVIKFLGEYYKSNAVEELEETRRVYSQVTPGLPLISVKAIENVIANDKSLSGMNLNAAELLDLSFLERLAQERKAK